MNACIETRFHYIEFKQNQYPLFSKFFKSENQWLLFFLWLILLIKDNCNNGSNSTEKEKQNKQILQHQPDTNSMFLQFV